MTMQNATGERSMMMVQRWQSAMMDQDQQFIRDGESGRGNQ